MKSIIAVAAVVLATAAPGWARLEIADLGRFVRFQDPAESNPTTIYIRKTSVESVQTYQEDRFMHLEVVTPELLSDKGASRYRTYTWRISGGRIEANKRVETLMGILNGTLK